MNKQLVVTGIYGHLSTLREVIGKWEPDKEDLVFMGDLVDYGHNSYGVIKEVMALKYEYPSKVILLVGKHESMLEEFIKNPAIKAKEYFRAGGVSTITSFSSEGIPIEDFAQTYYLAEEVVPKIDFSLFDQYLFYSQKSYDSHYLSFVSNKSEEVENFVTQRKQLDYPRPFVLCDNQKAETALQSNYLAEYLNKTFYDKKSHKEPLAYKREAEGSPLFVIDRAETLLMSEIVYVDKNTVTKIEQIELTE